ncbi:hypothetical protein GCM10023063_36910 [Arthrobacter methylotrophus]|uniref:ABC transporter substrate-binding protein n=1 Tax=Arthrobacter methylotrophus TaxID=121291 RepID=A0ABV5UJY5_9MICC
MNKRTTSAARMMGIGLIALSMTVTATACGRSGPATAPAAEGGLASAPGFDGNKITLGVLGVTTGALAEPSGTILEGMQAYYKALNDKGGIAGKYKVDLLVRDTAYDPAKVIQEYNSSKANVLAYTQIFGTAMTNAILPDLNADGIIGIPSSGDGTLLHQPSIMMTTAPAEIDVINGIEWATSQPGQKNARVCYAALEGALGASSKDALYWGAGKMGLNTGTSVTLPLDGDYTPQIQELRRDGCQIIMTKGSGVVLTKLLSKAAEVGFAPQWMAPSSDWIPSMKASPLAAYMQAHLLLVKDATIYGDTNAAGMADMMAAHDKYTPNVTPVWLYTNGYSSAMALTSVIEKAIASGDLSRKGMMAAFNSTTALDFKGLQGNMPWGAPAVRAASSVYSVIGIDVSTQTGQKIKDFGVEGKTSKGYTFQNKK